MINDKASKPAPTKRGPKRRHKPDPGLVFQEYLGTSVSPEEALFKINEFLHAGKFESTRKNVRAPLSVPVAYKVDDNTFVGTSYTLSQKGMFVKCPHPPPVDTPINIELQLPDESEFIHAEGEVVHSIPLEDASQQTTISGMSVVFRKIKPEDRRRIDRVVKAFARRMKGSKK